MLFNSIDFAIFFIVVVFIYYFIVRWKLARTIFLLCASYFFYMYWNPYYIILIVISTLVDFYTGRKIFEAPTKKQKKFYLILSLTANLGILGFFKYFNFFSNSIHTLFSTFGINLEPIHLNVLLPVGISFYTFQTMSYSLDIYFGKLKPVKSFLNFALFVSFFPQLVAGPIVRAKDFLPQIDEEKHLSDSDASKGLYLILTGLIKKVVFADFLAINFIDRIFDLPREFSSIELLVGVYAYTLQIYCDFSGYSDIAIGTAKILGFRLPQNFNEPYKAENLRDFWRRWHISLSTWLRDYLYIPLGGSRKGSFRTYINLMITMFLGGLWHGANWTFVFWGTYHGVLLAVNRFIQRNLNLKFLNKKTFKVLKIVFTYHLVALGWVFFRSQDFETAFFIIKRILEFNWGILNLYPEVMILLATGYILHFLPSSLKQKSETIFEKAPAPVQATVVVAIFYLLKEYSSSGIVPFIYFQF